MISRVGATRHSARGFTWIELMNFVSLAAVLATLGMYALGRYVRHAKTAEAVGSVAAIAQAAATYYNGSDATQPTGAPEASVLAMRHFPPSSRTGVPPEAEDVRAKRYQSSMADWSASPWRELHFSILQPQFYAYAFDSSGTGSVAVAAAIAHGDLDGDGVLSTYRLAIAPDDKLTAQVSPILERTNPEE